MIRPWGRAFRNRIRLSFVRHIFFSRAECRPRIKGICVMFRYLPLWTWLSPIVGWLLLASLFLMRANLLPPIAADHAFFYSALGAGLIVTVLAAVHHAEVVAHRIGEPFGTLVLAL